MLRIDTDWHYGGLRVVRMDNDQLQIDVLPELGAKIYRFVHKPSDRDLLWHNPHLLCARTPFGACFDDHWSGGWDELVPNDPPCRAPGGDLLPDHGEVWGQEAQWEIIRADASICQVRFSSRGRVLPTLFEKTLTLVGGDAQLRVDYSFTNFSPHPIDFLWNIHPAMSISPQTRLDIPARIGIFDPWRETRFDGHSQFEWPYATDRRGNRVDMRRVDPSGSAVADMCYLVDVREGWYAITDQNAQVGFALSFPQSVFKHVWLFRTFGGWRGLYTLIPEASVGYPTDLSSAIRNGTCGHLESGATLKAQVRAIAYSGLTGVAHVDEDGRIRPVS